MLYSLTNFMLWVYFYNYQRSLFWVCVFAVLLLIRRAIRLGLFCLIFVEFYRGYLHAFRLELSVGKLLCQAGIFTGVSSLLKRNYRLFRLGCFVWDKGACSWAHTVCLRTWGAFLKVMALHVRASHGESMLSANAFNATYCDSGVWDTFLLVSFDRAYRSILIFSILPLSESNVVEKMSVKLFREFTQAAACSTVRKNLSLGAILRGVAHSLTLVFIFMAYTLLLTV